MALSRPDFLKNSATIATSPNQEGREGTNSEESWMCTDVCVILRVYPPYGDLVFFFLLSRHTFVFFTSILPFLPIYTHTLPACSQLVAHPVGDGTPKRHRPQACCARPDDHRPHLDHRRHRC